MVGDGDGRLAILGGLLEQRRDAGGTVEEPPIDVRDEVTGEVVQGQPVLAVAVYVWIGLRRIDALHREGRRVFAAVGSLHMTGAQALPKLMAARGYPDLTDHKRAHDGFDRRLNQFHERFQQGHREAGTDLLNLLSSWWMTHISTADTQLANFLHQRPASMAAR